MDTKPIRNLCWGERLLRMPSSLGFRLFVGTFFLAFPGKTQAPQKPSVDTLIWAIEDWDSAKVRKLLSAWTDLNVADAYGRTPLAEAISNHLPAIAIEMIHRGADVNFPSVGWSPLMYAAWGCEMDVTLALLERKAIVDSKDQDGETALELASDNCTGGKIVQILLKAGANPNSASRSGITPLIEAADSGNERAVEILIAAGADLNAKNSDGDTALSIARDRPFRKPAHDRIYAMLLRASAHK